MTQMFTLIYTTNIYNKYESRPDKLENMCLVDFFSTFNYVRKVNMDSDVEDETFDEKQHSSKITTLKDGLVKMRKRCRPCFIRFQLVS